MNISRITRKVFNLVEKLDIALDRQIDVFFKERPFLEGGEFKILNYEKERIETEKAVDEIASELKDFAFQMGVDRLSRQNESKNGY